MRRSPLATPLPGSVDPIRDLEIIHGELLRKDVDAVRSRVDASRKNVERGIGGKDAKEEFLALEKALKWMEAGKDVRAGDWTAVEIEALNKMQLLTAKPMVYLVNLSEKDYIRKANKFLPRASWWWEARGEWGRRHDVALLPLSPQPSPTGSRPAASATR